MKRWLIACLAVGQMSLAQAVSPVLAGVVGEALRQGRPFEAFVAGQRVVAVPLDGARCPRVGLVMPGAGRSVFGRGPRIDHVDACPEGMIDVEDLPPALPSDARFREAVLTVLRSALRYGGQRLDAYGHTIQATRLAGPDRRGCGDLETWVTYDHLLVSYNVGWVCPR